MPARRRRVPATVVEAVEADLAAMDAGLPGVAGSGEARAALVLARELDAVGSDAPLSARVAAAREIREAMAALRARVPDAPARDRVDELASRRARRVGR